MSSSKNSPTSADSEFVSPTSEAAGLVRAASLLAIGNVVSRLLGLVRETVIANLFGATGPVSAFRIAQILPTMLYDLLIGGMVSSALVPVFSEQAERNRAELWRIASLILSLAVVGMSLVILVIELAAPLIARLMAIGFTDDPELLATTTYLLRLTTPALFFLGLSGIVTALLHALRRFTLPAFTAATFNATLVIVALVGVTGFGWGIEALAYGLVLGAVGQVVLQLPALRDASLHFNLNLRHPALRRIGRLTLPILLGLIISSVAIVIDRALATFTGEQSVAWMQNATTIIQFPLGLISAAISLAILPTLSRLGSPNSEQTASTDRLNEFMNTLATGLRLVLILIIPATVALFILAYPVISLLFEHGRFTPFDTQQTVLALRYYLLGLTFAAIDQPLIFAFYARQNTLTPALVGLLGVGFYLTAALLPGLYRPLQMTDLVLANSIQLTGHAMVMLWLVHRLASLRCRGLGMTTLKAVGSAGVMGGVLWWMLPQVQLWFPPVTLLNEAVGLALLMGLGATLYLLLLAAMRTKELGLLAQLLRRFV